MPSQLADQPGLAAYGARIGEEFRLGACTAAWPGRRASWRSALGALLLFVLIFGLEIPPILTAGLAREITSGLDAAIFALGVLFLALPPRSWTDRLFLYQAGIVLVDAREPEPKLLRWAHLDTVTITTASGYDNDYVSGCVLKDRAGNALTVTGHLSNAIAEVAAEADRVLAPARVPGLIARFTSGQPLTIGHLTADLRGLSWSGAASGDAWQVPWSQISVIQWELEGQRAIVKACQPSRESWSFRLDGQPNSFLIRYLIARAAATAGITVTGHAAAWDGETAWDPEATITAPALPAPGLVSHAARLAGPQAAFPEAEAWRPARKRHPALIAIVVAVLTGSLVGWALTFDHSGPVAPSSYGDNGDHVASLWPAR
jgi:hypothetical protein